MQKSNNYILFDIDSDSIGVLVFEKVFLQKGKNKDSFFREIFSKRKKINKSFFIDFDHFFIQTKKTLDILALEAFSHTGKISGIDEIYLNFSAPWVTTQKRIIHFEKENPFVYNDSILESLLEQQRQKKSHQTRDYHKYQDLSFVDQHVLSLYANGYKTTNLSGKEIQDLDVHTLVSFISPKSKKMFFEIIERHFHRTPKMVSNIFMEYFALTQLFPQEKNILSFDLSAEMTEIFLIENGVLSRIASTPVGSRTIVRSLSSNLNISFEKASSILSLYSEKKLDKQYQKNIDIAMEKAFLSWFKEIYEFLREINKEHQIPHVFSLVTDEVLQSWIQEWMLKSDEVENLLGFGKKISLLDSRFALYDELGSRVEEITDSSLLYALTFLQKNIQD